MTHLPPTPSDHEPSFDASLPTEPPTARVFAHETAVIPVVEEVLVVDKQTVEAGRVRITKSVREREEEVEAGPLERDHVHVERVPINQTVDQPPSVRQEGDTTIIPVLEEVLVVEKRLILREEIRVTRTRSQQLSAPERVRLRSEEVVVERIQGSPRAQPRGR